MNKSITNKNDLIENIKNWVTFDSQLKLINDKTKILRENKNELTKNICNYATTHNIKSKIEISDGTLTFCEKKDYSPLTYSYVEKCLGELINDKEKVDYIIEYMKSNREVTKSYDIRRSYNKNLAIKN